MKIRKTRQTPGLVATVVDNLFNRSNRNALSANMGNQLREEGVIVSTSEPVDDRRKVWIKKTINLFNKDNNIEITDGYREFEHGIGVTSTTHCGLKIKVDPNTTYVTSSDISYTEWSNLCFFDKNMTYISGIPYNGTDKVFTTPLNCDYITVAILNNYQWFQLEKGTEVTNYTPYVENEIHIKNKENYEIFDTSDIVVSLTEPIVNRKKIWIQKSKNLFNKAEVVTGSLEGDGSVTHNDDYVTTFLIPVVPGQRYYKSSNSSGRVKLYYKNKLPYTTGNRDLDNFQAAQVFIIPDNIYYIRFTVGKGHLDTFQLEQGSTATAYEPYVKQRIYLKNNNNVYEEFIDKEEINKKSYSTEEQIIGTWVDGKPVYRKVVFTSALEWYYHNLNIKDIIDIKVNCNCGDVFFTTGRWGSTAGDFFTWFHNSTNKGVYIDLGSVWTPNYQLSTIILEYTKTTD